MAKTKSVSDEALTTGRKYAKQFLFEEAEYDRWEEALAKRGSSPSSWLKKAVRDYIAGQYVELDKVTPETIEKLKAHSKKLLGTEDISLAINSILNLWANSREGKER